MKTHLDNLKEFLNLYFNINEEFNSNLLYSMRKNYDKEVILNLEKSLPYIFEIDSTELNIYEFIESNSNIRFSNITRDLDEIYVFVIKNINTLLIEKGNRSTNLTAL